MNVGQAGPGNICRSVSWQVATYPLLSSLVNALPHSYRPRRARFPSRSLVLVAPDRSEFLSVRDDEPRDNGTAGTCRGRHRGGGKNGAQPP